MHVVLEIDGEPFEVWLVRTGDKVGVEVGTQTLEATVRASGKEAVVGLGKAQHRVELLSPTRARIDGREVEFRVPFFAPGGAPGKHEEGHAGSARVKPPMPGRVVSIKVREGEQVRKGQVLLVLESMKMQNEVPAPFDARVAKVHAREGQTVESSTPLVDLEG